ncbi:MAG: SH3 domain-containing protein [Muribaculaceae bacterium]|nr:SH3 domain-containing protein [Muribaculaceae bacterium]
MKRLFFISLLLFAFVTMDAQTYYVCTGNSVYLRIGPGKSYEPVTYYSGPKEGRPIFLYKGTRMMYVGPTKNGYARVNAYHDRGYDQGWVSTQYIRPEGSKTTTKKNKNKKSSKKRRR